MLDLQKRMSEGAYKKTREIVPKTSSAGVWCLVLGMPQRGGEAVEGSTEEMDNLVFEGELKDLG